MADFGTMKADLALLGMANLLNADFGALLNKCQREEVESYPWSFLFKTIIINSVPPFSTGTVTTTTGSTVVSGDSGLQFPFQYHDAFLWIGPTETTPYMIDHIESTSIISQLILSKPYLTVPGTAPVSVSGQPYTIQPLFYDVSPLQTVFRVKQIDLLVETSQEALNRIDASRIATGGDPALRWAPAPFDNKSSAPPVDPTDDVVTHPAYKIELWPRPSTVLPYIVDGKIGPVTMVDDTDQPQIPSQVLEAKAMMYACRAVFASSGNPKWMTLAESYKADYTTELEKAIREDSKRIIPQGITSQSGTRLFDAAIDYNHDLFGPPDA